MKTHLKTLGVIIAIVTIALTLAWCADNYRQATITVFIIALAVVFYCLIYNLVRLSDK